MISRKMYFMISAAIIAAVFTMQGAFAQDDEPTLFLEAHCMKAKTADYIGIETDVWLPVHQQLVNDGRKNSWALYSVKYGDRSKCTHYTVETYSGAEQFNSSGDYGSVFTQVHSGKDVSELFSSTIAARDMNESLLWITLDSTPIGEYTHIQVNWMQAEDPEAYVKMEREVFKPIHEAMLEEGRGAGWILYWLASPSGSSVPFNYATVDLRKGLLLSQPDEDIWAKVHPGVQPATVFEKMEMNRKQVRTETWELIASTKPAGN